MRKLIFCNLDLLKEVLDQEDYAEYDFEDFDFERFRSSRDAFIR